MRLVKISAPVEKSGDVIQLAFSADIEKVSKYQAEQHLSGDDKAKKFIDALLKADFYTSAGFSVSTRQPRSILPRENIRDLTVPLCEPVTNISDNCFVRFCHLYILQNKEIFSGKIRAEKRRRKLKIL